MASDSNQPKRVLILGSGFGGLYTALHLEKKLRRYSDVQLTLVNRQNAVIAHLGDSNAPSWNNPLRREPRDKFIPGQFICPHGACFDRDGNIYVVEWVEVGRVTKLRRVA